jgi:DNA-binding MarR family transcriptional regulator
MPRRSIGIDDVLPGREGGAVPEDGSDAQAGAERFAALFRALYLTYHRRDGPRSDLPGASRAVLTHLAVAGPLTVGEAAVHLGRAQSVVSEIVDGLARKGLLERERDPADRRRTLVWLTGEGRELLRRDGEVLAVDALAAALGRMPAAARAHLLDGAAALLAAAPTNGRDTP